jgi:Zn/Cd-binding protein ZinT
MLQTTSIKLSPDTNTIKIYAEKTKAKMEQMYQDYINSIPILNGMITFTERVAKKQIKTKTYQYQAYLKIVYDLASGIKLQFMDNVELAKQLKGVYVGKYSQKAFEIGRASCRERV